MFTRTLYSKDPSSVIATATIVPLYVVGVQVTCAPTSKSCIIGPLEDGEVEDEDEEAEEEDEDEGTCGSSSSAEIEAVEADSVFFLRVLKEETAAELLRFEEDLAEAPGSEPSITDTLAEVLARFCAVELVAVGSVPAVSLRFFKGLPRFFGTFSAAGGVLARLVLLTTAATLEPPRSVALTLA